MNTPVEITPELTTQANQRSFILRLKDGEPDSNTVVRITKAWTGGYDVCVQVESKSDTHDWQDEGPFLL